MAGKGVQRQGDPNSGGGLALVGHNNVVVNGRRAAIPLTPFSPHPPCPLVVKHCIGVIAVSGTSKSVFANGKPLVIDGGTDSCGHIRILGSFDVKAT